MGDWRFVTGVLLLAGLPHVCPAQGAASEKALWAIWQRQLAAPDDHAGMIAACAEREQESSTADPLLLPTRQIRAWHLLKSGDTQAGVTVLASMIETQGSDLQRAAAEIARAWTTRVDRELVRVSLKTYYNRNIAFPKSLAALQTMAGTASAPLADRWGMPWEYRLKGFKRLTGLSDQKYELLSAKLGRSSDLNEALAVPFACRITLTPIRVMSASTSAGIVQFADKTAAGRGGPIHLSVGARHGRNLFPFMGESLILLSDGDHWKVFPKPRGTR